jgi:hypothetical protein
MVRQGDTTFQDEATILPNVAWAGFSRGAAAGTGTVAYTGYGFRPSYVIFFQGSANEPSASWGIDDGNFGSWGGTNPCLQTPDNESSPVSGDYQAGGTGNPVSIFYVDVSGAGEIEAYISSMDADGFTLQWTQTGSPGHSCQVRAFAFK